jgi:acetamidase/formamidase
LTLDNEDIVKLLTSYEKESKALREEILRLCWFMRGGLTYDEAYMLSSEERDLIGKIIDSNMETTKKSGLPFF